MKVLMMKYWSRYARIRFYISGMFIFLDIFPILSAIFILLYSYTANNNIRLYLIKIIIIYYTILYKMYTGQMITFYKIFHIQNFHLLIKTEYLTTFYLQIKTLLPKKRYKINPKLSYIVVYKIKLKYLPYIICR